MKNYSKLFKLTIISACVASSSAYAGLFSDDEARVAINQMKQKNEEKFEQINHNLFEMTNLIGKQNDEIAKLRGAIETLHHELDVTRKQQKDLYVDVDSRIKKQEDVQKEIENKKQLEKEAEEKSYNEALGRFKDQKFKEASWGFTGFLQKYPESNLASSAQFWLGNSFYALGECKKSIDAQKTMVEKYPTDSRVPDALLVLSSCQIEEKQVKEGKLTLEKIIKNYPTNDAAEEAKKRLRDLDKNEPKAQVVPKKK